MVSNGMTPSRFLYGCRHVVISANDTQGPCSPSGLQNRPDPISGLHTPRNHSAMLAFDILWECAMRRLLTVLATLSCLSLTNCGYNAIQTTDEQVKSSWSEVVNQYQRRADLIPNLVNSVKGFAQQEKDVLLGVTNARAKVGSIQATPEVLNDPAAFQKFQAAQGELSSALSRLLVVTENYPQLKSDALFRDLMAQLEGTENRITVARNRYIKAVQEYNVGIRTFPNNLTAMAFGYKEKPNFTVDNEKAISTAPKVDFNPTPAPAK
jgi:LemA protein